MKIKVNSELTQTVDDILYDDNKNLISQILLLAYPIGSYYWSNENTDPGTLFGGTWVQIKDKFVIAAGDSHTAGTSYGSNTKDISHTHSYSHTHGIPGVAHIHSTGNHILTVDEIPSHSHYGLYDQSNAERKQSWGTDTEHTALINGMGATEWNGQFHVGSTGGGGAHNHGNTGSTTPSATTTNSQSTSTSESSSNLQPYITCYMWKRTA